MTKRVLVHPLNPNTVHVYENLKDGPSIRNVKTSKTFAHERKFAHIGVSRHTCMGADGKYRASFALTAAALIRDVHSPMDYTPVHANWEVVY